MALLEREPILTSLDELLTEASRGVGHVVLLAGEAGIGKTSIVDSFIETRSESAHILWGGCDDLLSARPLGPVWDMAMQESDLATVLREGDRHEVFTAVLELMSRSLRPTLVVIEDVHWADDSTLDLIKFLGRRISDTHGVMLLTYRDDEIQGDHPLRLALGDLPSGVVKRMGIPPLTPSAVLELAGDAVKAESIWEVTQGNAFYVTEMIASADGSIPLSIRDAILARVLRLSHHARRLSEIVSVIPGKAELALLERMVDDVEPTLRECEEAGILDIKGMFVAFRHELARRAVEGSLSVVKRRSLNREILAECEAMGLDVARCTHHARQSGDADAIVRLVPIAARRAANAESHREALQQLRALEPFLDRLSPDQLADHYDLWAWEEHIAVTQFDREIIEKAVGLRRILGDPTALGNSLLMASRIAWVGNRRDSAVEHATEAASVLEPIGGEQLAFAYSTLSQLAMLASDEARTKLFVGKALEVAGEGPSRARAHALNNLGAVKLNRGYPDGTKEVEESFHMNAELGLSSDQIRAAVNIAWSALEWRDLPVAERWIERGLAIANDRELSTFQSYLLGEQAILNANRGDWVAAEGYARAVIDGSWHLEVSTTVATMVLAKLQLRQGLPEAKSTVFEAWELAHRSGELQRLGPAAAVMAEYSWVSKNPDSQLNDALATIMNDCLKAGEHWYSGDIAVWLYLNGALDRIPDSCPEPYVSLAEGKWAESARFWDARGIPYERAIALSTGDTSAQLEALEILDSLCATPVAARLRGQLQRAGVTGVPRGPQTATKQSPLGLTPRQTEVVKLLADGLTNSEIADHLFVSSRTVDHHVSAILSKTGTDSRHEAVEAARTAGLLS